MSARKVRERSQTGLAPEKTPTPAEQKAQRKKIDRAKDRLEDLLAELNVTEGEIRANADWDSAACAMAAASLVKIAKRVQRAVVKLNLL